MREEDYADIPDDVMAEYFAARRRRRSAGSCSSCIHNGCCDCYCGGRYWRRDKGEDNIGKLVTERIEEERAAMAKERGAK